MADWITCPTCGGSGKASTAMGRTIVCPDCVDGMTPSSELVERIGQVVHEVRHKGPKRHVYCDDIARAVLLASRQGNTDG